MKTFPAHDLPKPVTINRRALYSFLPIGLAFCERFSWPQKRHKKMQESFMSSVPSTGHFLLQVLRVTSVGPPY
ncbi:MAG: hypothetical protein AUG08_15930 [Acidobacteria bacterium 13_1_20CM_2_55_15]|nr:MAG: hypothetical protein AUH28_02310 [Acidobacteria bacterium 13_1_40CM_56_16]OLD15816.1 MAG: hypothetical protein AUI91_15290 [Acidobacteria bacterium 13_1_40CM_3_56_11]OLD71269.1 MAG: hypothetical protein AUI45_02005 [Acidobacteria bacterium 13_1_40CM_2_56_11]OLE86036.1 MAG: hypothetical protein AUG08_15930 [Acidobacteria bacterium 13_1_20CM_2_55_15]PYS14842.1 MAG: hypothetical protein DMG17_16145 [Acidobacteriota bacterium]